MNKTSVYPIFDHQTLTNLPTDFATSIAHVLTVHEPVTYKQAKQDPRWVEAMAKALCALDKMKLGKLQLIRRS